jgi:hypothetical protein
VRVSHKAEPQTEHPNDAIARDALVHPRRLLAARRIPSLAVHGCAIATTSRLRAFRVDSAGAVLYSVN